MICARRKTASNPRRRNLAVFLIEVRGFVSGKRNSNKHALALTDFQILESFCKSCSDNVSPILFSTARDEGNQQWPSSSATSPPCSASTLQPTRFSKRRQMVPAPGGCSRVREGPWIDSGTGCCQGWNGRKVCGSTVKLTIAPSML